MRIKYSEITVDSVFHLPCGCGFPEDVEITDIPEELIARIDQLSADTNKTVLSPADISDCVSVSFSKLMIYESVSLKIKLRFTPVGFVCARMRSSEFIISLLEKNLKFDFKCTTDKQSYTPAMLAVDLGNTRTCAVVCPDIRDVRMEKLHLFPHYNANIEPSNGVWDSICVLGKSAVYEHVSPSFVRLGKDNMFYLRNGANNSSTALRSLSTPKRYFWDTDEDRKWILVRPGRTEEYLLREQTDMELAKHIAEHSYAGKYPRAMILEGTIYEMLEQAERMMNQEMDSASQYHAVTNLTMTYPAAWSSEEIEAYRVVVQRSIDLYVSQRCLNIPIKLHMECNEATAVLVNYIYSEAHHFGNGETWLKLMGKPDFEGSAEHSLRVAVIDIGGGTSDIAVISLGGIVESSSIKVAGDKFDESLVKYIRRKHNVLIGERTAEEMKKTIGCVWPFEEERTMEVKGRCLLTGLPRTFTVSSTEMIEAFEEVSSKILEAVHSVLERTAPELVGDIATNGIVMTGGGSLIYGFDKLIESKTGIATRVADDAISCVAYGTGKALENIKSMQDGTLNISRRRQMF